MMTKPGVLHQPLGITPLMTYQDGCAAMPAIVLMDTPALKLSATGHHLLAIRRKFVAFMGLHDNCILQNLHVEVLLKTRAGPFTSSQNLVQS